MRRATRWLGFALVAAGIAVFGYVGWQLYGTNWSSHRTQAEVVRTLERTWSEGPARAEVEGTTVGAILRVPRFGADYAVPVLEGTSDETLAAGIGHFADSVEVGAVGNYALAAHRITHGEPFADLPALRTGDQVVIETRDTTYTYELVTDGDALVVPFTEGWVLDSVPRNPEPGGVQPAQERGQRLITLTTCAELFRTDDRSVVFGRLVDERPRPVG